MSFKNIFPNRLRMLRLNYGITQIGLAQEIAQHPLGIVEIRDNAVPQGAHCHDVARRPAQHDPRLFANGHHLPALPLYGHN